MSIRRKEKKKISWCFLINSLQNDEIWKKQVRTKRYASFPTGSYVAQLEQTANSRSKIMQPRTTGPITSPCKYFFSFFFRSCWLEVSNIMRPHNFTPFLLVRTGAVSFSSPARGAALCSQDAVDEDGHDGSANQARDGHSHKPRHEDVSEQAPVYCLPWAQPSYCNHRAHLKTKQSSD